MSTGRLLGVCSLGAPGLAGEFVSTVHYSETQCLAAALAASLQTPNMQAAELAKKIKPRSRRARRILEKREPKLVRLVSRMRWPFATLSSVLARHLCA